MQDKVQEKTQNPVLAIFKELAQKRGITLEEFADSIGYTPKVVEAMEQRPWLRPSDATLKAVYEKYELSEEEFNKLDCFYVGYGSEKQLTEDHQDEFMWLYNLMTDQWRAVALSCVRQAAEAHYRSQEPGEDDHRRLGF